MRVLLVEDEVDLLEELAQFLGRQGYDVAASYTITMARKHLHETTQVPDIVVSDVILTDGSGIELCREFSPRFPRCKWLLISGAPDLEALGQGLVSLPRSNWLLLAKPVSMRQLLEAIRD